MSAQESLRIVITGRSSGIGEAIALEMAKSKHQFYLIGRKKERFLFAKPENNVVDSTKQNS
ncbi:MAG: hypothetical protein ACFFDI_31530 [Promethearchaeota archaeon]